MAHEREDIEGELASGKSNATDYQVEKLRGARRYLECAEELLDTPRFLARRGWDEPGLELLDRAWRLAREAAGQPDLEAPTPITARQVGTLLESAELAARARGARRAYSVTRVALVVSACLGGASLMSAGHYALRVSNKAWLKPWRTSSESPRLDIATRTEAGVERDYFFETAGGAPSWVEVDLLAPTWIWGFALRPAVGRGQEAAPLSVTSSIDGKQWRSVATRSTAFARWTETFWPQKARYLRVTLEAPVAFRLAELEIR